MKTLKENALAILNGEQPDYYGDFMDAMDLVPDPILLRDLVPPDGLEHKDSWGTTLVWKPGAPGQHPHITPENVVLKDILNWENEVTIPTVEGLDWTMAEGYAANVDRDEKFLAYFCLCGLFERSHYLMGMEDAFCAYLEEPEAMFALLTAIKDFKIACIEEAARHLHPEAIFFHDDWGSKQNLFLPPETWREMIKPLQREISEAIHDNGMLYVHHSDCICAPIVEDMVEIGIDLWQGTIAQNPIPEIKERTRAFGRQLPMIGGIDGPALDVGTITEEEIRQAVRDTFDRVLPGGKFFPSIPNGACYRAWNDYVVKDEARKYGRTWAVEHPVGDGIPADDDFDDAILVEKIGQRDLVPNKD